MEKIAWFERPTQVRWIDEEGTWHTGIAYGDEIICACCGGVQEIDEVYEYAPKHIEKPIVVLEWIDLTDEINGDEVIEEAE